MDSHRLVKQIWNLVAMLEAISSRDLQEYATLEPDSAAELEDALRWAALRTNQAVLDLLKAKG